MRGVRAAAIVLSLLLVAAPAAAQDLDPRAYARVPVDATFLISGLSLSHGGVVSDASLPLTDVHATVETPSLGIARSFSLFGQTAQAFAALLYDQPRDQRWTVKQDIAVSQPLGKRWLVDTHAALWVFTANNSFYPGTWVRTQSPIGGFQTHISYSFRPPAWAAFDAT